MQLLNRQGCCAGSPVHQRLSSLLLSPLPHRQDPGRLAPGSMEKLVESALKALPLFFAFAQREDASGRISGQRPPQRHAGATQQHVESTGARRLSAAFRHAVSITGQLRQQQHEKQHRDLLLGQRDGTLTDMIWDGGSNMSFPSVSALLLLEVAELGINGTKT